MPRGRGPGDENTTRLLAAIDRAVKTFERAMRRRVRSIHCHGDDQYEVRFDRATIAATATREETVQ